MKVTTSLALCAALSLTGCANIIKTQPATVHLTAVGYGAMHSGVCESQCDRTSESQRRLLAMRASRLDAYRAMAEQVYGVRVAGDSTVGALALKDDRFKVYIDAFIRGAKVVKVTQNEDGTYETTVEMDFDGKFAEPYVRQADAGNHSALSRGTVGPGAAYGMSFYNAR